MTYEKQNDAILVGHSLGADACTHDESGLATLVRVGAGAAVSPTQRFGRGVSARTGGGAARREQSTYLEYDASGPMDPVVRWSGICHHPYVENVSTGRHFLVRVSLASGEELEVDMARQTVKRDGAMVWGYTGRWFDVKPGDLVRAGAEGIGAGFSAEVDIATVNGLITKPVSGASGSERRALGRPQVDVARAGAATKDSAGSGGRQGVGSGKSPRSASGTATKKRGYA